jgi:hypothetical protein
VNDQIAKGLGYFSVVLGLADLVAARAVCRAADLEGHEGLVRVCGGRELATGVAILRSHDATPWVWGRVAGDAIDIATVAAGAKHLKSTKTLALLAVLAAVTGVDLFCAVRLAGEKGRRATARTDYHDRSGFPRGIEKARGAARDFAESRGRRQPEALRPLADRQQPRQGATAGATAGAE